MTFQKIILIIAIVLLIIVLAMFGYAMYNNKQTEKYPPVQSECPDYWKVVRGKDGIPICKNVKNLGSANCDKEKDFTKFPFIGSKGDCNRQKWARTCGVTWDGITNAHGIC